MIAYRRTISTNRYPDFTIASSSSVSGTFLPHSAVTSRTSSRNISMVLSLKLSSTIAEARLSLELRHVLRSEAHAISSIEIVSASHSAYGPLLSVFAILFTLRSNFLVPSFSPYDSAF